MTGSSPMRLAMRSIRTARAVLLFAPFALACGAPPRPAPRTPGQAGAASPPPVETFADPFVYCSRVRNVDALDARYVGPRVPDAIARAVQQSMSLAEGLPPAMLAEAVAWRCMNRRVYACFTGANLPCFTKANVAKAPTDPMLAYCRDNPEIDSIPETVTGQTTVYEWRCEQEAPKIVRQVTQVDDRGF